MFDLTLINTNARSLCPKVNSLITCFEELEASLAVITETWLSDGPSLAEDLEDLKLGAGLGMLTKNRPANPQGYSHGGIALVYHESAASFHEVKLRNVSDLEVLVATGKFQGLAKPVFVVACYVPPGYTAARGTACLEHIRDSVVELKRRYSVPHVVISGDFNQWPIQDYLIDFNDLKEIDVGPSRGDRKIDRTFVNFAEQITASGVLPPLEPDTPDLGAPSDHKVTYISGAIPRVRPYKCCLLYTSPSPRD